MPADFQPLDPDFDERVRATFSRQRFMESLGAKITEVSAGRAVLTLSSRDELAQQPGVLHAGVATALLNSVTVCAANTLVAAEAAVLAVEFKVDLLEPAQGVRFSAVGEVVHIGRTLARCDGVLQALGGGRQRIVARMAATLVIVGG